MGDRCNAAQAAELVRALRDQLRDMTTQLTRVESHVLRVTAWNRPAHEILSSRMTKESRYAGDQLIAGMRRTRSTGPGRATATS
jgi:type IV pilus biogenesis protein CpaD/CtpE